MNYKNLINRIKQNDNSAVIEFYNEFYKEVYYVCYKITENEKDAEDIAQETLIKALDKLDSLKNPEGVSAWLKTIANNLSINYLRKNRKFDIVDNKNDLGEEIFEENRIAKKTPEDIVADKEVTDILTNMINKLPREQRITIFLFYYEELSVKEIAEIMDCSEATVRSRINYARKALRKQVDELENKGIKLRCIAILPFLFTIYSFEKTGVCQSVAMPNVYKTNAGMQGEIGSIKKVVEVGGEVAKMSMKIKIAIGAVAAVVLVGGTIGAVSALGNNNSSKNSDVTENSGQMLEEEYETEGIIEDNKVSLLNYEEIGAECIGEYKFDYSVFISDVYEFTYINFEDDEYAVTLDFTKGDIYPVEIDANQIKTNKSTYIRCFEKGKELKRENAEALDASCFKDVIPENSEAKFFKRSDDLILDLYCEDVFLIIEVYSSKSEEQDKYIENIKKTLLCISKEYKEDALNTREVFTPIFRNVKFNSYEFNFEEYEFEEMPYVYFTYDNGFKISTIYSLPVKKDGLKNFQFTWDPKSKYVNDRVSRLKEWVSKIYEIKLSENDRIRIYEHNLGHLAEIGFIKDNKEYLQHIDTEMNIDELVEFLGQTLVVE